MGRAVDLGCHEGYPGHHVYNMLLERDLARGRGWVEYMVYPLYSPQSLIAEGSANEGVELAFPGNERLAFERRVLYPLAGMSSDGAETYAAAPGGDRGNSPAPASPSPAICSRAGSRASRRSSSPSATACPRAGAPSSRSPSPSIIAPM